MQKWKANSFGMTNSVGYQTFASKFAKAFALAPQGLAPQAFLPSTATDGPPGSSKGMPPPARSLS